MSLGHVSFKLRPNCSIRHIRSAAKLAKRGAEIERLYLNEPGAFTADIRAEYEAYAVGCIFLVVAFLEATINELFADAAERSKFLVDQLDANSVEGIGALWKHESKFRTLERYQLAL